MEYIEIIENIMNPYVVIILMGIGAAIKHITIFDKIENNLIPIVLSIVGIALTIVINYPYENFEALLPAIAGGISNALYAIAIHSSGKSLTQYFKEKINNSDEESVG